MGLAMFRTLLVKPHMLPMRQTLDVGYHGCQQL
jgi:hypothetical protein